MLILNKRDSLFWKFSEYLIYVYLILFPFINFKVFLYGGSSTRSASLILLTTVIGILFAFYLFKKDNSLSIPKSPILLSLLVYMLFSILSASIGLNFHTSFWSVATRTSGIWYLLNLGFFVYILWAVFGDRARQNKLVLSVVVSSAVFSFLSLLGPEGLNWVFKGYSSDAFTFGNSSFAGMYLFGAFLLSVYYLLQSEKKKWWMFVLPIATVINPNFINSAIWHGDLSSGLVGEARASAYVLILSLLALFVIWLILKIKNIKTKSNIAYSLFGISVLTMLLSAFSLLSEDGYLRQIYLSQATSARPLVWEMSEKAIAERPVLGSGTDNFERVFEVNYDNRLLQDEYGGEAWFDRAHNVFIDKLVENGFLGLISYIAIYLVIVYLMIYVMLKSKDKRDKLLASILLVYFPLHFIELQTAFDTTISYPMVAIMLAFSRILFDRARKEISGEENEWDLEGYKKNVLASTMLAFFAILFLIGWIPFVRAHIANGYIRTIGSSEERVKTYPVFMGSPVDKHSMLWRASTDFQRAIGSNPEILQDKDKFEQLKNEVVFFENAYREYVEENPSHFRAKLNMADILIYERLFGIDKLAEAQEVLDEAIDLVPQSPQPYWMKAVAYIYMKEFDLAREYAEKGLELNPDISQSQEVVDYVEDSIKTFPEIDLYFFRQI